MGCEYVNSTSSYCPRGSPVEWTWERLRGGRGGENQVLRSTLLQLITSVLDEMHLIARIGGCRDSGGKDMAYSKKTGHALVSRT
ncbi:uncharacterized protein H6S33_008454 [Morchella sextelata]|uniref:uncharacterized protein n=1 Tax=Morchella sextelata TaxID=1174677 RepID=UPI001D04E4C6|nr:uncharacterized protein H6S33_008454 [Morchella sextelata]KAH0602804.1 hypothetical protein H6S33_008454 [Morchella sextelata]